MRLMTLFRDILANRAGRSAQPRFLTYIVTFACNARCVMCDCWKKESRHDLHLGEIEEVFRQLPRMDAVRLTGGEPFIRSDLVDIAHLTERHLRPRVLHVTTNGFLTGRVVEFCEQRSRRTPLRLLVSLDGAKEKHNRVRGRSYAWETAIATVEQLAPRQKELRLRLSVNQVVLDAEGVEDYRSLRAVLKPLGVPLSTVMGYRQSATYHVASEVDVAPQVPGEFSLHGDLDDASIRLLLEEVEKDTAELPFGERWARRYYLSGLGQRLLGETPVQQPACVALNSHLRLYPDGTIPICQFNSRRVGDLRRQTFHEVWESAHRRKARDWVRACSGCWAECEVFPNALYAGDLFALRNRGRRPRPSGALGGPAALPGPLCPNPSPAISGRGAEA